MSHAIHKMFGGWILFLLLEMMVPFHTGAQTALSPKDSISVETYLIEGKTHRILGDADKAKEAFQKALDIDPANAATHYELARLLSRDPADREALEEAKLAVRFDPGNPWYLRLLANISRNMGDYPTLAEAYAGLVRISARPTRYLAYQADAITRGGAPKKALKLLKKGIKQYPKEAAPLLFKQADILHEMGKHKDEHKVLRRMVRHRPDDRDALHKLASTLLRDNRRSEALEIYQTIYRLDPTDTRAAEETSLPYLEQGDYTAFFETLEPVLQDPDIRPKEKVRLLMPAIQRLNQAPPANLPTQNLRSIVRLLTHMHPDDAVVFALAGDTRQILGEDDKALDDYRTALHLQRNVLSVWEQALSLLLKKSDWKQLLHLTEEATTLFPVKASFPYYKAIALYHLHRLKEARQEARQSYIMSGRNRQQKTLSLSLLALIRVADGQVEQASKDMQKALKINHSKTLQILHSFVLAHSPASFEDAFREFKNIPGHATCCMPESAYVTGALDLIAGRYEMAIKTLEPLLEKAEPIAFPRWLLLQWLQQGYQKWGQVDKANEYKSLLDRLLNEGAS